MKNRTSEWRLAVSEVVPWMAPAVEALEDAHLQWHDAADSYHVPSEFRRHLEALIQSVRNVSFRLQSQKGEAFFDFDPWYIAWQSEMRSDPVMKWLNDSRVQITKKGGLEKSSIAIVQRIDSYSEPETALLRLPADIQTVEIVRKAIDRIPERHRQHQAIEIRRRWEADLLPGREILGAVTHCIRFLDALLFSAAEGTNDEPPARILATIAMPPCMTVTPDQMAIAFEADTGEAFGLELASGIKISDVDPANVAKHYGIKEAQTEWGSDLFTVVSEVHEVSRAVFKKDGVVFPLAFFRAPAGGWVQYGIGVEDKRGKFMVWRALGRQVLLRGYDAFVFTGEAWAAPMPATQSKYVDVAQLPGREEFVTTFGETESGEALHLSSSIRRPLGMRILGKRREMGNDWDEVAPFAAPIRRAWALGR